MFLKIEAVYDIGGDGAVQDIEENTDAFHWLLFTMRSRAACPIQQYPQLPGTLPVSDQQRVRALMSEDKTARVLPQMLHEEIL